MKVPYVEGVASHDGPESCGGDREVTAEALTGESAGQVLSRENRSTPGCRRALSRRKAKRCNSLSRELQRPRVVGDPVHARKLSEREPGDPTLGLVQMAARSAQRTLRGHGCDARGWEVGQAHRYRRSCRTKAGEIPAGGDGGGKGPGQGESAVTKQVPDAEPGEALL
jgi:hypothetical protein